MNKHHISEFDVFGNRIGVMWNDDAWKLFSGGINGTPISREADFLSAHAIKELERQMAEYEQNQNDIM